MPTYQRSFDRDLADYLRVAEGLEAFCAGQGLSKAMHARIRVVIEELILNLIDHATGTAPGRIDLQVEVEPACVAIVVEDDADPFDPRSVPAFDNTRPQERGPRGMGIHLVRSMTEEMDYQRIGLRNRLRVVIAERLPQGS
jgi:anti-sigma regulatory factor (Ser/Thr protein kinase)